MCGEGERERERERERRSSDVITGKRKAPSTELPLVTSVNSNLPSEGVFSKKAGPTDPLKSRQVLLLALRPTMCPLALHLVPRHQKQVIQKEMF